MYSDTLKTHATSGLMGSLSSLNHHQKKRALQAIDAWLENVKTIKMYSLENVEACEFDGIMPLLMELTIGVGVVNNKGEYELSLELYFRDTQEYNTVVLYVRDAAESILTLRRYGNTETEVYALRRGKPKGGSMYSDPNHIPHWTYEEKGKPYKKGAIQILASLTLYFLNCRKLATMNVPKDVLHYLVNHKNRLYHQSMVPPVAKRVRSCTEFFSHDAFRYRDMMNLAWHMVLGYGKLSSSQHRDDRIRLNFYYDLNYKIEITADIFKGTLEFNDYASGWQTHSFSFSMSQNGVWNPLADIHDGDFVADGEERGSGHLSIEEPVFKYSRAELVELLSRDFSNEPDQRMTNIYLANWKEGDIYLIGTDNFNAKLAALTNDREQIKTHKNFPELREWFWKRWLEPMVRFQIQKEEMGM